MTGIWVAVALAAGLVCVGQWISLRALDPARTGALPARLQARVRWWGRHARLVTVLCAAVIGAVVIGLVVVDPATAHGLLG